MDFKEYLQNKCINASQLARKMGISREAVSGWVNGVTSPRPVTMKKMAIALEVPYNEILFVFYGEHKADKK